MSSTTSPPSRTVLGPLTTVFTPPSSCSSIYYELDSAHDAVGPWLAQICLKSGSLSNDIHCFPPPQTQASALFAYSPGISCPAGWSTACYGVNADHEQSTLTNVQEVAEITDLLPGETAVGCCPIGFECDEMMHNCYSVDGVPLTANLCASGASTSVRATVATFFGDVGVPMITMYWQASDRPPPSTSIASRTTALPQMKFTVPFQSSQSNSISSGTNTLQTTPLPPHLPSGTDTLQTTSFSVPPHVPQPSNGIFNETKIAIGLAATVPVTVLTGLAILVICILRRGRKKRSKATESTEYTKPELEASEPRRDIAIHNWIGELPPDGIQELPAEVPANWIGELPAIDRPGELGLGFPHELEAPTVVHELEGSKVECTADHVAKRSDRKHSKTRSAARVDGATLAHQEREFVRPLEKLKINVLQQRGYSWSPVS